MDYTKHVHNLFWKKIPLTEKKYLFAYLYK